MSEQAEKNHGNLASQVRQIIQALAAAGQTALPGSADALLYAIVEAAARIFGAGAASILLVNEADLTLEFKTTYGASNRDLVGTHIPIDRGIAGYVVLSGQPLAASNLEQDPRFNRDFAKSTGYVPRSILATPLVADGKVIGVMEVLDKVDAPSFGIQDMDLLALFAQQAAMAIHIAASLDHLEDLFLQSLKRLAKSNGGGAAENAMENLLVAQSGSDADDLREMAGLLFEFSQMGETERQTALKVMRAFAEYGHTRRMRLGPRR